MKIRTYFSTQAPRIGCGWRTVEVISEGPKWVKIQYAPLAIRQKGQPRNSSKRKPIVVINQKILTSIWRTMQQVTA
jgi:hypothetical protein